MANTMKEKDIQARPFLKWAGGKGQLIDQIFSFLPVSFKTGRIKKHFEPFLPSNYH